MSIIGKNQIGFTIIELLIASTVFSFVVLGASMVIIQISRLYYKGMVISNTHALASNLLDTVTRSIQYESTTVNSPNSPGSIDIDGVPKEVKVVCIGDIRYTFVDGVKQGSGSKDIKHTMWRDKITNSNQCNVSLPALNDPYLSGDQNSYDVLAENMRVVDFLVDPIYFGSVPTGLYKVDLKIIYGDDDLIDLGAGGNCKGQVAGSQWCSVVDYSTVVFKRIN